MKGYYGAKCHLCTHIEHRDHPSPIIPWLDNLRCPECSFCQENRLAELIQKGGMDLFSPEVRRAVEAFKRGESDPRRKVAIVLGSAAASTAVAGGADG